MRKPAICKSSQLAKEVVCRDFAFKRFNVKSIQDREGENSFRVINCCRKEVHVQQLIVQGLGIRTLTDADSLMGYSKSIHNAKNDVIG
jgi:hypothetical protein